MAVTAITWDYRRRVVRYIPTGDRVGQAEVVQKALRAHPAGHATVLPPDCDESTT